MSDDPLDAGSDDRVRETVQFYDDNLAAFWEGTKDHDVSQNRDMLLAHIETQPPCTILDLGCGPGRDLKHFRAAGHRPIGIDASVRACTMAREFSGAEVWHQDFLSLDLPANYFDGIFANASLFHVPSANIDAVLTRLHVTLKPGGVLLSSNPRGENQEGWQAERFGVFYDLDEWCRRLTTANFELLEHYFRPPGRPLHQQPWLVTVARKID